MRLAPLDAGTYCACCLSQVLALALNCAVLALIDAGVPLIDQVTAVSCGVTETGDVCMDLLAAEEQVCRPLSSFAALCTSVQCIDRGCHTGRGYHTSVVPEGVDEGGGDSCRADHVR